MLVKPAIRFPQSAEQVTQAYHRYLESIAEWSDMLPTRENAEAFAELLLIPAWKRKEPILIATIGPRIVGATFTTLPDDRFAYRVPFASGHGTWVAADCRNKGIGRLLLERVRQMLKEKGIRRQCGIVHSGNNVSRAAFLKMGFFIDGCVIRSDL
jgi:GNAT superfamily N-acetyltransferase